MDVNSTDAKSVVTAAKAAAKASGEVSKSDEFASTLASLLGKTGSRMSDSSNNGLQSSSSEGLEDGNLGSGRGEEMAEARQSVHADNDDARAHDDDRPVADNRDDHHDYNDREPASHDDDYNARSDDGQYGDEYDNQSGESHSNELGDDNDVSQTQSGDESQSSEQDQSDTASAPVENDQNNNAADATAAAIASAAQSGLASKVGEALNTNDKPVIAVTTQLQAASTAGENTKGNNNNTQGQGRASATDGLNQALAAIGKATGPNTNTGEEVVDGDGGKKGFKGALTGKADGKANPQNQIAANNTANAQAKVAENMTREVNQMSRGGEAASTKTNQAAAIAKAIGSDTKVAVEVKVENVSETLVSRPRTSLTTTSAANAAKTGQQQGQTQTQGANSNAAQAMVNSGQQMAAQAQTQLASNNAAKGVAAQGAAVQATSTTGTATPGAAPITIGGGESIANLSQNQSTNAAAAAQKSDRPAPSQRNVMEQVTVQITKAVNSGMDKINIQLRPASLGRVDVQLEMSGDGRISATIIAENRDTLDMLQRGSRDLAKALNDAGLQADSQDLNFSLRENNQQAANNGSNNDEKLDFSEVEEQLTDASSDIDDPATLEAALRKIVSDGRIDIRA